MLAHLEPVVVGHRFAHVLWQRFELLRERPTHVRSALAGQLDHDHEAGGSLYDGADGALVILPDDQVALPVAWDNPVLHLLGAVLNAHSVWDGRSPVRSGGRALALTLGLTKVADELFSELTLRLEVDVGINALV